MRLDLAWNNLQWLICYKTKPNQISLFCIILIASPFPPNHACTPFGITIVPHKVVFPPVFLFSFLLFFSLFLYCHCRYWQLQLTFSCSFKYIPSNPCFVVVATLYSIFLGPFPPSFLDAYSLSMSSLGCKAFWIVINFLVFWSISLSSSRVHYRNGPKYLTKETALVFIPLIRLLYDWSFNVNHHITYIGYFVASYLFLL